MSVRQTLLLQLILLLSLQCLCKSISSWENYLGNSELHEIKNVAFSPHISPSVDPQPLYPFQAPTPLMPFTHNSVPKLSGRCSFNFSAVEHILGVTATDCWASLAPYLANVVCCPQVDSSLAILIGQSSIHTRKLALNDTEARHCVSDFQQIMDSKGASESLLEICSVHPSNLTKLSCPVTDVNEIEEKIDSSALLVACEIIDPANECCNQVCQNAISDAAEELAVTNHTRTGLGSTSVVSEQASLVNYCKDIVLRWLASKLDPASANRVLRVLTSCKINKACPLLLPDVKNVSTNCGYLTSNQTACCNAMDSYLSQLQEQSFVTNLQALNCAASLGLKLQRANISSNIYKLCQINLKDFSLQVDSKVSGCLFPSLPSDVTYDKASGINFICDLNDNVAAPWPLGSVDSSSSCNRSIATKFPELPKATSAQSGIYVKGVSFTLWIASVMVLRMLA
ncbi:uncharacterized GPI-anchored protein At1g61900-like isoform X1 [Olea europaea var. sylvestris]|uniref:uncharacterized GPI-anchored protein At1g61900-like isoform X1 n=1 Tax=Olea europaea var. sylvestris TaxID=158386 RepID=UPI000C1D214D|nr:uncharacterized GPI-anchored protein At1g61900-like isoform X1 [Olea europaea var. sylvestris]